MTGSPRDQPSLANLFTFFGRLLASWLALMVCASYGVVASIALRLTGYGGLSQWTVGKAFEWVMGWAVGVEFVIIDEAGALKERPAIFVGNHQTEMDVLMLGCLFPPYTSVTAKKSLQYLPFLGWFMVLSKTVFIDRANSANARAAFDGAVKHMKSERQNVYIFPEGTRSYASKPELLPFKKGAFHLAVQAQVPIVPCVVANYSHILSLKKKLFLRGKVPVKVLPPIHTKGMTAADVPDLAQRVRDMMLDTMIELERQRTEGSIRIEPSSLGTSTAVEERKAEKKKAR
ncbi:acyltransferase-domain-containing protein [Patellaria atrata CBS 101060]|uniref:1-acyl-sn-glycerol-3-phosphate acyltransferase n=1 Tax=Patellaria atrata CBS 101060 TaxID=1346257 RepID=A0A9P4VVW5_9PEZI|nr:acyltransferase-domain-containing protein [Patellaria atrata CBS 101060]